MFFLAGLPLGFLGIYNTFVFHVGLGLIQIWLLLYLINYSKVFIAFVKSIEFLFFQNFCQFLSSFHVCREYTHTDVTSETLLFTMVMEKLQTSSTFFTGLNIRLAKLNSSKVRRFTFNSLRALKTKDFVEIILLIFILDRVW